MAALSATQTEVIRRCQTSTIFFLKNFGKTKHPTAGILPLNPFKYQIKALDAFRKYRFNIFKKSRQTGASKIAGAFALWFAMFFSNKTVLIVSRTDEDAINFLRENIIFLFRNLPQWMQDAWKPTKENEHEIRLPNGSRIRSLTSHPDVLRSNASSLNIIDEAAFIRDMGVMWAAGQPCARFDTLVQTENGLIEIEKIGDKAGPETQLLNINVATDDGFEACDGYKIVGKSPTIIVNTKIGFEFEGTGRHKLRIIDEDGDYVWKSLNDVNCGDIVATLPGQFKGCRRILDDGTILDERLAEILGFYIGDGCISTSRPKRVRIFFDPQDVITRQTIIGRINNLNIGNTVAYTTKGTHTLDIRWNSAIFVDLLVRNGLNSKTSALDAEIPPLILQSDKSVLCAFLRGLFDTDGYCCQTATSLKLSFSSASEKLCKQVQIALHSLGIISRRRLIKATKNRFSERDHWTVNISHQRNIELFRELIGFVTIRKQKILDNYIGSLDPEAITHPILVSEFCLDAKRAMLAGGTFRDCKDKRKSNLNRAIREGRICLAFARQLITEFNLTNRLSQYLMKGLYFDTITGKSSSEAEVYDLSVPANNTYLANGFVSHNTLIHGGSVIVISTTSGVGGWYWNTWTDAIAGFNNFHPINIDWWDMDWEIRYRDDMTGEIKVIAPIAGIRDCITPEEIEKYGPKWSPWLEEQYRGLQERGETWKFRQEILAEFVGSGSTVLDPKVLAYLTTIIADDYQRVKGPQTYVHPVKNEHLKINFNGGDRRELDKDEGLWVWRKPNHGRRPIYNGKRIIDPGEQPHRYSIGIDIATGKGRDYFGLEVLDIDAQEQVAEMMIHTLPKHFKLLADYIGRWYNNALMVIERNNGGDAFIDDMRYDLMYPNLWRKHDINDKPTKGQRKNAIKVAEYGFYTGQASKPTLNKALIDYLQPEGGYKVYSRRLLKQLQIYVRKKDRAGRDTDKTEAEEGPGNHDDLVIGLGLACIGINDAASQMTGGLIPFQESMQSDLNIPDSPDGKIRLDSSVLAPISGYVEMSPDISISGEVLKFAEQLGSLPTNMQNMPPVANKKYTLII